VNGHIAKARKVPQEVVERARPMREKRRPAGCTKGAWCWVERGPVAVRNRNGNHAYCVECGAGL
jgi:hypothetical protein